MLAISFAKLAVRQDLPSIILSSEFRIVHAETCDLCDVSIRHPLRYAAIQQNDGLYIIARFHSYERDAVKATRKHEVHYELASAVRRLQLLEYIRLATEKIAATENRQMEGWIITRHSSEMGKHGLANVANQLGIRNALAVKEVSQQRTPWREVIARAFGWGRYLTPPSQG